jgi:predicted Zn-dependent peptidase
MQSVIFQEIRELRSFAYASGAGISQPFYKDEKASLSAYVGTQADKTREAVEVMYNILSTEPSKEDRIDMVRKSLIQSVNSSKPGFRQISGQVARFRERNYTSDPRRTWSEVYNVMSFDDIKSIYNRQFYNKPSIITIIGDESKIGMDWMSNYGKVIKVSKADIFNH